MTPAARLQAAVDLLERIAQAEVAAERVVADYLRGRRYVGAKDRRALADLVFAVLRRRARLGWWLRRVGLGEEAPRQLCLAFLLLGEGRAPDELAGLLDGTRYHPAPLSAAERQALGRLAGERLDHAEQPAWVRAEAPEWLLPAFVAAFGPDAEAELRALAEAAPLDLRVNVLAADREHARAALAAQGIAAEPTPFSPLGLRVAGRRAVLATRAFGDGLVEIQDEGSQLVALLTGARPGMTVVDYCAGAGGKTLALAGAMANRGRLLAFDADPARLGRAGPRLRRAGVEIVRSHVLGPDTGPPEPWRGECDRVLVDAPCSGCGTWRRQPDARWRLRPDALARRRAAQAAVLEAAAALVRPRGWLVYATCSLLPAENREPVAEFLARRPDFAEVPAAVAWREALGEDPPPDAPSPFEGPHLLLTPARHGTDGFFAAVLERRARA